MPVSTVNREEGPAYGAALLAAVGSGAFRSVVDAVRATLTRATPYAPDPRAHGDYTEPYRQYRASYRAARRESISVTL